MKKIISIFFFIPLFTPLFSQNLDIDILKNINLNRNKNLDHTFKTITNTTAPLSIAAPVIITTLGLIEHDSTKTNKGLCIGASMFLATSISVVLKYAINRPRPFITYPALDKVSNAGSPSFPSGHTSDAFARATSLSLAYQKWYVIAPSYLWACSVGYSRMHLGVHYPSDVLAGAIIGSSSAYLCYKANSWLYKHRHK